MTAPLTIFDLFDEAAKPWAGRRFHRFAEHNDDCVDPETEYCGHDDLPAESEAEADLISSIVEDERNPFNMPKPWPSVHKPVIDIDGIPIKARASSTTGNYHLFIDHPVDWPNYLKLLEAMADCGIVQPGYLEAAKRRGYTSVRHPDKPKR